MLSSMQTNLELNGNSREFANLAQFSAEIGRDPLLIQGPGGNTSIKDGETLWIKASGTCLSDAESTDIFLPVQLDLLIRDLANRHTREDVTPKLQYGYSGNMRPSIETPLHAIIPDRIVIHVHCVNTIAIAARTDAELVLREKLHDMAWWFVPYVRPGLPLVAGIEQAVKNSSNIIILGNHGLIVSGESVLETRNLLRAVQERLRVAVPTEINNQSPELNSLCAGSAYVTAKDPFSHQIAFDADLIETVRKGPLYPDHVVFLGMSPSICTDGAELDTLRKEIFLEESQSLLVPGHGALIRADAPPTAHAMLRCLADVLLRQQHPAPIRHLSARECEELLNWDAEKHRRSINRA